MAEVKLNNLLRLYRLRSKFDAVILAVHACLVERGFRCINSGEEVRLYCSTIQWTAAQKHELENAQVAKMLSSLLCQTQDKLTTMTNWAYFNLQWGFKLYFTFFFHRGMHSKNVISERLFHQTGIGLTMFMLFSTGEETWVLFSFLKPWDWGINWCCI